MRSLLPTLIAAIVALSTGARAGPAAGSSGKVIHGEIPVSSKNAEAIRLLREGRSKALNFEDTAAAELLRKALALEPELALAQAWLGRVVPGAEGVALLDKAAQAAAHLPETERLSIEALRAERRGDDERARLLKRTLADLAPEDWWPQFQMGVQAQYDHKSQASIKYLERAVQLNPAAAEAYNYLGYVLAAQGMADQGVAAARKFVELRPDEPNAYDSLGEVLLLVGRFDDAEKQFRRAGELAPTDMWMSWGGVAYARAFRGDQAGARDAIERGLKAPLRPADRAALGRVEAWTFLADGKVDAALKVCDQLEKEAHARKDDLFIAWAALDRGELLFDAGRAPEALEQAAASLNRLGAANVSGNDANRVRRQALLLRASAAAKVGQLQLAQEAIAALEAELRAAPSNNDLRGWVAYARGLLLLAQNQPGAAVAALQKCPATGYRCRLTLAQALELAGDRASAEEVRHDLRTTNARDNLHRGEDPNYLFVRQRLSQPAQAAAR